MSAIGEFQNLLDAIESVEIEQMNDIFIGRWLDHFYGLKSALFVKIVPLLLRFERLPKEAHVPLANILLEALYDPNVNQWVYHGPIDNVRKGVDQLVQELRSSGEEVLAARVCAELKSAAPAQS